MWAIRQSRRGPLALCFRVKKTKNNKNRANPGTVSLVRPRRTARYAAHDAHESLPEYVDVCLRLPKHVFKPTASIIHMPSTDTSVRRPVVVSIARPELSLHQTRNDCVSFYHSLLTLPPNVARLHMGKCSPHWHSRAARSQGH
jgi:hypothetical protein